jgi:hypothetical protein
MNEATLEKLVQWYMATVQPAYVFGWQGGEPALMGHEFFRTAIRLQRKYSRPGAAVSNGIQTNATLVDDRLAACLAEYRFLAGVSLDGPQELHDHYRLTTDGQGSYRAAMKGIRALRRNGVEFNILVLVNAANVGRPREIYRFLKSEGFNYHQYIPCVEFDARDRLLPFSVTGRQWGSFLTEIFDEWYPGDTRSVSIRHFDSILEYLLNGRYNVCSTTATCIPATSSWSRDVRSALCMISISPSCEQTVFFVHSPAVKAAGMKPAAAAGSCSSVRVIVSSIDRGAWSGLKIFRCCARVGNIFSAAPWILSRNWPQVWAGNCTRNPRASAASGGRKIPVSATAAGSMRTVMGAY